MRELPRPAAAYILLVALLGAAVLGRATPYLPHGGSALLEVGLFIVLTALADLRQLELSYNAHYSVATAVNFAGVIIFGPAAAIWISAIGSAAGDLSKRKPWYRVLFNACAIGTSVAAGGAVFEALRVTKSGPITPQDLPALAAYAAVNMTVNHSLVATVIGLATRTRPWDVAAANYRGLFVPIVAMFPLGVLMAVTYTYFGGLIGLALLVVPTVAVYGALDGAQKLRAHTRATLEALADTIDQRDRYTAEHSKRVADYADQIGLRLGLSLIDRQTVVAAARVHDLGKISTPDAILRKQGPLSDEEWEVMREHPMKGADILRRLPMYQEHAELVSHHHERLDGAGYPDQIAGRHLPAGARILAVADAFDAMTSDRPYRSGMPFAVALGRLRESVGTQFSPEVVEALAKALGLDATAASTRQVVLN